MQHFISGMSSAIRVRTPMSFLHDM